MTWVEHFSWRTRYPRESTFPMNNLNNNLIEVNHEMKPPPLPLSNVVWSHLKTLKLGRVAYQSVFIVADPTAWTQYISVYCWNILNTNCYVALDMLKGQSMVRDGGDGSGGHCFGAGGAWYCIGRGGGEVGHLHLGWGEVRCSTSCFRCRYCSNLSGVKGGGCFLFSRLLSCCVLILSLADSW